jgi:hypothetical protein
MSRIEQVSGELVQPSKSSVSSSASPEKREVGEICIPPGFKWHP